MSPRLIAFLVAAFAANASATELLLPGVYHGDEVAARNGEVWMALVQDADGRTRLESRAISVEVINDPVLDDAHGASGKRVGAGDDAVLFYLRDLPGASAGKVTTAYSANGEPLSVAVGLDRRFELKQQRSARLQLLCADDARGECALQLSDDARRQVLARWATAASDGTVPRMLGDDAWPHLRWAGDIDRDGQLDLLIDTSDHYNVSQPTLFLSSQAKKDQLVGVAALLRSVGC